MDRTYIAVNKTALERLRGFIAGAGEDLLRRPMSDGWTVSAYLAHMAFFDRRVSRILDRINRDGLSPSPYDVHILNDAMKPAWLLLSPADAAAEALAAAEEADAAVERISDEMLTAIIAEKILSVDRAHHRNNHLDEFEALTG